jgi:hypothetical protein
MTVVEQVNLVVFLTSTSVSFAGRGLMLEDFFQNDAARTQVLDSAFAQ